jgi:hypothetical protein
VRDLSDDGAPVVVPGCRPVGISPGAVLIRVRSMVCPDGRVPVTDEGVPGIPTGVVAVGYTVVRGFFSFSGFTGACGFSTGTADGATGTVGFVCIRYLSDLPSEGLTIEG